MLAVARELRTVGRDASSALATGSFECERVFDPFTDDGLLELSHAVEHRPHEHVRRGIAVADSIHAEKSCTLTGYRALDCCGDHDVTCKTVALGHEQKACLVRTQRCNRPLKACSLL